MRFDASLALALRFGAEERCHGVARMNPRCVEGRARSASPRSISVQSPEHCFARASLAAHDREDAAVAGASTEPLIEGAHGGAVADPYGLERSRELDDVGGASDATQGDFATRDGVGADELCLAGDALCFGRAFSRGFEGARGFDRRRDATPQRAQGLALVPRWRLSSPRARNEDHSAQHPTHVAADRAKRVPRVQRREHRGSVRALLRHLSHRVCVGHFFRPRAEPREQRALGLDGEVRPTNGARYVQRRASRLVDEPQLSRHANVLGIAQRIERRARNVFDGLLPRERLDGSAGRAREQRRRQ